MLSDYALSTTRVILFPLADFTQDLLTALLLLALRWYTLFTHLHTDDSQWWKVTKNIYSVLKDNSSDARTTISISCYL